jgi:Tfp pilus assembly protein PilN
MLTLNLVSAVQKKEIKLRHVYGLIKTVNYILIIIAIIIAIILLVAKTILQSKFNEIVSETTLVTKTNQGYNNNVREINDKLNFIGKIQNDYIPWSVLLTSLAEMTPSDVSLNYLKVNSQGQTIKIKGNAKLRSSLLDFKDRLATSAYFKDIEFPIQNILEKENIDFEINAKLNLASL